MNQLIQNYKPHDNSQHYKSKLVIVFFHHKFQCLCQTLHKFFIDTKMFNLMTIIILCHKQMGALGGRSCFNPIIKFFTQKFVHIRNMKILKNQNVVHRYKEKMRIIFWKRHHVELKLFMAMHDKIFYAYKTNCNMK